MGGETPIERRDLLAWDQYATAALAEREQFLEGVKGWGQEAAKMLLLLNGGSIIALLTFLGALLSKGEQAQMRMAAGALQELSLPFRFFGGGVALAAAVSAIAYVNFSSLAEHTLDSTSIYRWLKGENVTYPTLPWFRKPAITAKAAVAAGTLSLLCFLAGAAFVGSNAFPILVGQAYVEGAPRPPDCKPQVSPGSFRSPA